MINLLKYAFSIFFLMFTLQTTAQQRSIRNGGDCLSLTEYKKSVDPKPSQDPLIERYSKFGGILARQKSKVQPEVSQEIDKFQDISIVQKVYQTTNTFGEPRDFKILPLQVREGAITNIRFEMNAQGNELDQVNSRRGMLTVSNAIIILILVLVAVFIVYRFRIYFILKEQKLRNETATDLNGDVGSKLSRDHFFSGTSQKLDNSGSDKFHKLSDDRAIEGKEKINDIIWSIDPESDDWKIFLTKSKGFAAEMFESKEIEYVLNIDPDEEIHLNIMYRKDLWLVFKELVTNLVRHSNATYAEISLFSTKELTMLIVEDNGKGFDVSDTKLGSGLSNVRSRVESINPNNQVRLTSNPNKGTRWEIGFKI